MITRTQYWAWPYPSVPTAYENRRAYSRTPSTVRPVVGLLGRGAGVIDDDRADGDAVEELFDHRVGLVAEVAGSPSS